ncbi:hypothetical protein CAPTEDRAFT_188751 [Capitella teleta]|uniref:Sulfotransferase domain-containing protein n=1 Tax=Capitella teleta TaxID=283909 RepID=R7V0L1_CAPTE|nr:hypothetical protein CAPTEDRAFT_188751 [Capitella teleta]|eukprot:ELU12074.1 hypothetical protein CAPTEDRAFT_188751 [Capitella teleta]
MDPDGLLWYEPLDQFFMAYLGHAQWGLPLHLTMLPSGQRRTIPAEEHSLLRKYLKNMLTCNYDHLPTEALSSRDFIGQSSALRFVKNVCLRRFSILDCTDHITDHCGTRGLHGRDPQESWRNRCPYVIQKVRGLSTRDSPVIHRLTPEFNNSMLNDFIKHGICVNAAKRELKKCLSPAKTVCRRKRIQAVEVLRSNMDALDDVIQEIPDLFVVYLVRDPRAIVRSTMAKSLNASRGTLADEAKILCAKMRLDYEDFRRLNRKYPGLFLMVKYEDLVLRSTVFGNAVYRHIGRDACSVQWQRFIKYATRANKSSGDFGIFRSNGAESVHSWRLMPSKDIADINKYCVGVVRQLGYSV